MVKYPMKIGLFLSAEDKNLYEWIIRPNYL
jgi:hypothetical protein